MVPPSCPFQKARSVAGLVTTTIDSLLGGVSATGIAMSTVADSIIALRYLELDGRLRRGVLVVKLRGQGHDQAIHEYEITDHGFRILAPFRGVAGILAGRASFLGEEPSALPEQSDTGEPGRT